MKKKICFTLPSFNEKSGIVKVVFNLVHELINILPYDITLLSLSDECNINIQSLNVNRNLTLDSIRVSENSNKIRRYLLLTSKLNNYLKNNKFDVIVISGAEYVLPFWIASFKNSKKMVLWEHRNFMTKPFYRLEWLGRRIALMYFKAIVCITKKDCCYFSDFMNKHNKGGVIVEQIYNLSNFTEFPARYNTNSKKIISVGSLSKIKGYDFLLNIASVVLNKYPEWTWDIYGEGEEKSFIEKSIKEKKLEGRLNLKGYNSTLYNMYPDYSFFVFTSRAEGMGMVLLEAQKFHLPVISFDINCGPSDVIVDNVNGRLIPPFDIGLMSESICNLIENEEKRETFSLYSTLCHNEFTKDFILYKWKNLFNEFD